MNHKNLINQLIIAESRGLIESVFIFDNNKCYHKNKSVIAIVYFFDCPNIQDIIEKFRNLLFEKYELNSKFMYNKCNFNYIEPKLYIYDNKI